MRRYLSAGAASVTCPCHLPLVALLLAGTAAGSFITRNLVALLVLFGALFALSLWLLLRSAAAREAGQPVEAEQARPSVAPLEATLRVKILKTPGCASCNGIERSWQTLSPLYRDRVSVEVVDLLEHPEVAERYRVLSAPAVIVNDRLKAQGSLSNERLRRLLDEALGTSSGSEMGEEGIRA